VEAATVSALLIDVAPAAETVDANVAPEETTKPLSSEKVLFKKEMFWVDTAPVELSK
jgi:hypothetical protein